MPFAFWPGRLMRVLGCMSGTSLDGIDIACADLEVVGDELHCRYLGLASSPFDGGLRDRLVAAMPPCLPGAGELCELHAGLGDAYAAAFADARDELGGGGADLTWEGSAATSPRSLVVDCSDGAAVTYVGQYNQGSDD